MRTYTQSLEFLDRCPPATAEVYRYWAAKRAGKLMPRRADIDPMALKTYLPSLMLVDVVDPPDEFRYRLVGTLLCRARGYDPTGKPVFETFFGKGIGRERSEIQTLYRLVRDTCQPVFAWDSVTVPDPRLRDLGALLMPLSRDADNKVAMVMGYIHFERV
ncbi:PAS domain-containing protein [Lacibacterium aquatile]|uniref:PAS domain-containing protein n=1 Tax=Lacibacterium aquatile TaxID=1168082 RepID=A0ABW5DWW8_9PROT